MTHRHTHIHPGSVGEWLVSRTLTGKCVCVYIAIAMAGKREIPGSIPALGIYLFALLEVASKKS